MNKKRIYRLMKENGLLVTKERNQAKRKSIHPKPNAFIPNPIWGTDMTKIQIGVWG